MANKKISQLDADTPNLTDLLPASNAGGTQTRKVTPQAVLALEARWNVFKPAAPTSVTGTRGNGQVAVSWTAPANTIAQAPVTDYVVQFSSDGGSTWSTFADGTSTNTSATVTGLTNGTAYNFRVLAINDIGTGPYSTASSAVTPATTPGVPTALSGTAGDQQVALSWSAPASTGGDAITDYAVQYSSDSGSTWTTFNDGTATSTAATVTGLTNDTAYLFRVAATNSVGTGSYSSNAGPYTPTAAPTAPGAPTNVVATAGNAEASLTWSAPASNGGAAITDYAIQYSSNSGSSWTTFSDGVSATASATVTGLTNGTAYVFRVAATNSAGTGSYSSSSNSVTPATVPGAPTSVGGTAGDGQVSLSWTAPADNGGSALTDYVVQYSSNSGSSWTTFSDGTSTTPSTTVTGLTNGTGYIFRVAAVNAIGTGSYSSNSATITPQAASSDLTITAQPLNQISGASGTNVTFSVTAAHTGQTISYQWQYYGEDPNDYTQGWFNWPAGGTSSSVTVNGTTGGFNFAMYESMHRFRCVVSTTGTGGPLTTTVARWARVYGISPSYDFVDDNYNTPSGTVTVNGDTYQTISPGSSVTASWQDYGMVSFDNSWYSSNMFTLRLQSSTDASTWTNVTSWSSATGYPGSGYNFSSPGSGNVYYRFKLEVNWPPTTTNGTSSSSDTAGPYYHGRIRITWP